MCVIKSFGPHVQVVTSSLKCTFTQIMILNWLLSHYCDSLNRIDLNKGDCLNLEDLKSELSEEAGLGLLKNTSLISAVVSPIETSSNFEKPCETRSAPVSSRKFGVR